jgi:phosphoribosylformylglycinamidine cyclo-ligase
MGKLVLSPTRTYAPIIKKILDNHRLQIHGMVHCSGGAQTKVLHFIDSGHVIKDNFLPVPPLFKIIQEESNTPWAEMYKVFNMGHRMELYVSEEIATDIITISKSFNVDAQIVGRVEEGEKKLTIRSEYGEFEYS